MSAVTYATEQLGTDTKFMLLDLREPDEFAMCHIVEALNFPAPNISRDKIPPELYRFVSEDNVGVEDGEG